MTRIALAVDVLWRPVAGWLLVELPVAALAAAIIAFFVILPVRSGLDGYGFQDRMTYTSVGPGDPGTATGVQDLVLELDRIPVGPVSAIKDYGIDSPAIGPVTLMMTAETMPDFTRRILGESNVVRGEASDALIDVDTAANLGVGPGDDVVLAMNLVYGETWARVHIAGVVAPYVSPNSHGRGVLIVSATSLDAATQSSVAAAMAAGAVDGRWLQYNGSGQGQVSRGSRRDAFLSDLFNRDTFGPFAGVLLCATLLWLAIAWRSTSQMIARMRGRAALLVALGDRPRLVAAAAVAPQGIALMLAAVIGVLIAANGLYPALLRVSIQSTVWVPVAAAEWVIVAVYVAIALRYVRLNLRDAILESLAGPGDEA